VNGPTAAFGPLCIQVNEGAETLKGTAIAADNRAMPRIEPAQIHPEVGG
jgi:hypothetical protein